MSRRLADNFSVPCPKCGAPTGAPCADWRSHDKDLFLNRVHPERRRARRELEASNA